MHHRNQSTTDLKVFDTFRKTNKWAVCMLVSPGPSDDLLERLYYHQLLRYMLMIFNGQTVFLSNLSFNIHCIFRKAVRTPFLPSPFILISLEYHFLPP